MNRGNLFKRRVHRWHNTADHFQAAVKEQATSLAGQTREGLSKGQEMMGKWEKSVEDSLRERPMFFLGMAAALLGLASLLAAWFLMGRKK